MEPLRAVRRRGGTCAGAFHPPPEAVAQTWHGKAAAPTCGPKNTCGKVSCGGNVAIRQDYPFPRPNEMDAGGFREHIEEQLALRKGHGVPILCCKLLEGM